MAEQSKKIIQKNKKPILEMLGITRENQAMMVLLLVIIITILFGYFVTIPIRDDYKSNRLNYENLVKEKTSLEQKQTDLRRLAAEKESRAEFLAQVADAMPVTPAIPELLVTLEKISENNNLILENFTPREPIAVEPGKEAKGTRYQSMPIELDVIGKYADLKKFIQDIESNIRPINITNISISESGSVAGASEILRFNIKALIYYEDINKNLNQ